jgi:MFS transporter, SHS family, lactate transporter
VPRCTPLGRCLLLFLQVIFGVLSDRFGRKWPLVINLLLCATFELGAGFATNFRQFLALRSFFGIAMGGVWGLASATALENLPVEARGLGSGVLQQGYSFGYLFAAILNIRLVPHSRHTWRTLFWASAGLSTFSAFIRALVPESEIFLRAKALEREKGSTTGKKTRRFIQQASAILKKHWLLCIYAVLLMTGG